MKKIRLLFIIFILSFFVCFSAWSAVDPYYSKQWYLETIKAPQVWEITKGSSNVVVAVLDTGVDIDHPDIKDNIWINSDEIAGDGIDNDKNGYVDDVNGWDFIHSLPNPEPKVDSSFSSAAVNHGTFVAGLISAIHDNGKGIKGVTANVKVMPLLVLDANGYGDSFAVSKAVDYAVANGAKIINLSFGGHEHSVSLKNSITKAYEQDVLIVAAAGNVTDTASSEGVDLTNAPVYPICYDQEFTENKILGVLATTKDNKVAKYSNYGKGCVDIAAPGSDIISTVYQNSSSVNFQDYYEEGWNGNSFSAAMVSGAAALLKSVSPTILPKDMIKTLMEQSGLLFLEGGFKYLDKAGAGILNIKKALDKIYSPGAPVSITTPVTTTSPFTPVGPAAPKPLVTVAAATDILVAAKAKGTGSIAKFNYKLEKIETIEVFKDAEFKGLNIQSADILGDNSREIIVGAAKGGTPFVRLLANNGSMVSSFLAFAANFKGGVEAAAGDVDADGKLEIVVAPESGYSPVVRIFDLDGGLKKEFLAYNQDFKNGLNILVGDIDGDKKNEIVTAPHKGLMPKIKIFDGQGKLKKELLAYAPTFTGGVNISLADLDNNGQLDIITGAGEGGGPHVQAYNYQGDKLTSFMAYAANFTGGIEVFGIDWNKDGYTDIITAAGPGGGPHVKIFDRWGGLLGQFFAMAASFTSGINIAVK